MSAESKGAPRRMRSVRALGICLLYALVVGLMAVPGSLRLSSQLIGNNIDNWIFYWNNWWFERALSEGHSLFHTPYLFFPQGTSLVTHSNSFLNSLLAWMLRPAVGPVAAFNLTLLLGLWTGAVGMFLLVHDVTRRRGAGLVAGFVFAFAPYHLTQALAHPHLGSIHWWPFYALFLRRALQRRAAQRPLYAALSGLFAALTLWSGLQLAVLLALWTVAYVGWQAGLGRLPRLDSRSGFARLSLTETAGGLALTVVVALVLSAPALVPLIRDWDRLAGSAVAFDESMSKQTDLLAYWVPPTYHPWWGRNMVSIYERFYANRAFMPYLGYVPLALALLSLCGKVREARFWVLSGGVWLLLAAGPAPRLNGTVLRDVPLPYRFIGETLPISAIRAPDRFNLLVVLSLAVVAGLGSAWLAKQHRWLLVPVALLLCAEYLPFPFPAWDLPPGSPFLEAMAQDTDEYGVLDYPTGYNIAKMWLYYQTVHGKPTVEGHLSRYTPQVYVFVGSQPLVRALYQGAERPAQLPEDFFGSEMTMIRALGPALRALHAADVRYILVHEPYLDAERRAHLLRLLPILPVYQDGTLTVYDTAHPLPFYFGDEPHPLTPGVALVRFDTREDEASGEWRFRVMAMLKAPRSGPLACQLQLAGQTYQSTEALITFFAGPVGDEEGWQPGDLDVQEATALLPGQLSAGSYRWALACPGSAPVFAPDTLKVATDGRWTYLRRWVDVRYGEEIQLLGYRWHTEGTELKLALTWEALQVPRVDYKVFVHLLDSGGGIIRQYDAAPCHWRCPTSEWDTGIFINDEADLPLWGLSPGEYGLAVGLYHANTGERLPAREAGGEIHADGYFVAPDVFTIVVNP